MAATAMIIRVAAAETGQASDQHGLVWKSSMALTRQHGFVAEWLLERSKKLIQWMIHSLDKEAKRLGVTRQSIIKVWVAERLKKAS